MSVVVGTFTMATGTGAQEIPHSLGVTPKAAILWFSQRASAGFTEGGALTYAFVDDDLDCCSMSFIDADNVTTTVTSRSHSPTIRLVNAAGSGVTDEGTVTAWDADSFTIDWTTNEGSANIWHYILIGGDSVVSNILSLRVKATSGSQAYTGAGFEPQLVMGLQAQSGSSADQNGGHLSVGMFATDGTAQWALAIFSEDARTTSDTERFQQAGKVYLEDFNGAGGATATISSLDADGFTFNFSAGNAGESYFYVLCIGGLNGVKVGSFNKATGTAPDTNTISSLGFDPDAVFLASVQNTTSSSIVDGARLGIGGSDGTNEYSITYQSEHGVGTSDTWRGSHTGKAFTKANGDTNSVDAEADITLGTDQFVATWSTNDGVATEILYVAFDTEGIPTISGSLAADQQVHSAALSANVPPTGSISADQQVHTPALSGTTGYSFGAIDADQQPHDAALVGYMVPEGDLAATQQDLVALLAGIVNAFGTIAADQQVHEAAFSGDVAVIGSIGASQSVHTSALEGFVSTAGAIDADQTAANAQLVGIIGALAGGTTSSLSLPPDAVAFRLRADFYAHSVSRSGSVITEGTGAKVGAGPLIGGISDFSYDPALSATGSWSLKASSMDEGSIPLLDGTAKEMILYYENVGMIFHGRVSRAELDNEGNIDVTGFDLGYELGNRSMEYRAITTGESAQSAYQTVIDELADAGWLVTFEAIASTLTVPKQRFRHETVLDALRELNDVTGLSFRVHPVLRLIEVGDFGDDSGLQIAPQQQDDVEAMRKGAMLAMLSMRYIKDETKLINRVIPQAQNTSFGTTPELRHAHNRRDRIGNAEPRRYRANTLVRNYNFHGVEDTVIRSSTTVRPSPLGALGSPLNPAGPAEVSGPVTDHIDYASDNPDWNLGATSGRVAIGVQFTPDADAKVCFIASRWTGVLNLFSTGSAYDGYNNMAPICRIYDDSGGSPDETSPVTDWFEPTNFPNFNTTPGIFRTGSRPLDNVVYQLPPVECIHAFDLTDASNGTPYWAVYALTEDFSYSATQNEGSWLVPVGGPNLAAHSFDDLGSLWSEGVSAGSLAYKARNSAGTWASISGGSAPFAVEVSMWKPAGDFPYPIEVIQAVEVNENTNNDLDYETDTHGHRIFFMQDRDSIDANGLHSRTVSFPMIRDAAPGILDVWPQSDAMADACATLLQRAKDPFEKIQGTLTGAFRLPFVGQKVRFVFRGLNETENGKRVWLDLNALYWVQKIGWRINDDGIRHEIQLSNIPDDYLDPHRIMQSVLRRMGHYDSFFAEMETGANSGATVDPALIGA